MAEARSRCTAFRRLCLALHMFVATGTLDFMPSISSRELLDTIELLYLGAYFLLAAVIFLASYFRAPSGMLRQQLKWVTGGTIAGIVPFFLLYILPRLVSAVLRPWMKLSVFSLALIPLCFGYAIIRYRLMDVDIIFKRGLAYTFATAGVVAVYFAAIAADRRALSHRVAYGPAGAVIAIVVAAFLFQPLRDWVQARLDHFFYRDRLDYRRTLIEFGRALTNEVRMDPLLARCWIAFRRRCWWIAWRFSWRIAANPGQFLLVALDGCASRRRAGPELSRSGAAGARTRLPLFRISARGDGESESVRGTIEELELNYFIPCRFHDHTAAVLGLGKTVDGDYLSSEDLELLSTIAGYVAIAMENARLYQSLEQKALQIERLKDFSENIVESLRIGVLTVDLEDRIESWNPQLEDLLGIPRSGGDGPQDGRSAAARACRGDCACDRRANSFRHL